MAKSGRPKSDNPKSYQIGIRFDARERRAIEAHSHERQITFAETVRIAVRKFLKVK